MGVFTLSPTTWGSNMRSAILAVLFFSTINIGMAQMDEMPPPPDFSPGGNGPIPPSQLFYEHAQDALKENRYNEALEKLQFALQSLEDEQDKVVKNHNTAVVYNSMAYAYIGLGRIGDAKTSVATAIRYDNNEPNYIDTLGDVYKAAGDYVRSCAQYSAACVRGVTESCTKKQGVC
jgi:hypothetical protein